MRLRKFLESGVLVAAACFGTAFARPDPVPAVPPVPPQVDTFVVRRDTINISRGLLFPGGDTIAISIAVDTAVVPAVPAQEILRPLADDRIPAGLLTVADFVASGDSLRKRYDFAGALDRYRRAAALPAGAIHAELLEKRMHTAQNGLNLSENCARPTVIARQRFSRRDFFRFYPLPGGSWRPVPNVLDRSEDAAGGATYVPRNAKSILFSATDEEGFRHLYETEDRDSCWTEPALLDENLLSGGNEIFPMLSPDGNRLYFASDDLYGVGGYDLYCSVRDPETGGWGEPVNLGFPYSSPGDDFLLMDTADGKYTIFASNRACSADSVYIYVLEQQKVPFRSPARSIEELRQISALVPAAAATHIDAGSAVGDEMPDNDNTRLYQQRSADVSRFRDSLSVQQRALDILRAQLSASASGGSAGAGALTGMATAIARQEEQISGTRAALDAAVRDLQEIESDFLRSGVRSRTRRAAEREVVGAGSAYAFTKRALGPALKLRLGSASTRRQGSGKGASASGKGTDASGLGTVASGRGADASGRGAAAFAANPATAAAGFEEAFRIMPVGRFAQTSTLPAGLVYQISLFSSPSHASLEDLRGVSPVYERMTTTLRYTYAAGLFSSYSAALSHLPSVRRLGFPSATIIAFRNGLPIPVATARAAEAHAAAAAASTAPATF